MLGTYLVHGFLIHEIGDVSDNCAASGGHFNPTNQNHGGPDTEVRHLGDLGNIEADSDGNVKINIEVHKGTTLFGVNTMIGRTVVIHEGEDTLDPSSTSGNAGSRLACGIITDSSGFSSEAIQNSDLSAIVGEGKLC